MPIDRRTLLGSAAAAAAATLPLGRARAQGASLKIGVLTDMSGTYRDAAGQLAVDLPQLAVEEFGVQAGLKVEVVSADHQNKPDIGAAVAGQWFDRDGVDVIVDGTNSASASPSTNVAKAKNKVHLNTGAATSDLSGANCNANTLHWAYDTYALSKSTGGALVKAGGDTWFFVTADYAFGKALQRDTTGFVQAAERQGDRQRRLPVPRHHRLLLVPAAGAGLGRQGPRAGERRRRHHQLHQAGARSSA